MRKDVRLLLCMVLVLSVLLGMSATAFATTAGEATLSLRADNATCHAGKQIDVVVQANVAQKVTDGKLTLRYDDGLTFLEASAGAAWDKTPRTSVNSATKGTLTLTFAAETAAEQGDVFVLRFRVEREGKFDVVLTGGYLTGMDNAVLKSSVTLTGADSASVLLRADNTSVSHGQIVQVIVENGDEHAITDGKLTFTHDTGLAFLEAVSGDAWSEAPRVAVKATYIGQTTVTLSFAGVEAAKKGDLFVLYFRAETTGEFDVRLTGGYLTGMSATELNSTVTVRANCPSAVFSDFDEGMWYHRSMDYVVSRGLMDGMNNGKFEPDRKATRAMVVMVLYRMAGSPEVTATHKFADVNPNLWYADAIAWAYQQGITKGVNATHFAPDESVTREQLVAFMARFAKASGVDITPKGTLDNFKDGNAVLDYARDYMIWAVDHELIDGMNNGKIEPQTLSTRAMLATILMRLDQMLEQS